MTAGRDRSQRAPPVGCRPMSQQWPTQIAICLRSRRRCAPRPAGNRPTSRRVGQRADGRGRRHRGCSAHLEAPTPPPRSSPHGASSSASSPRGLRPPRSPRLRPACRSTCARPTQPATHSPSGAWPAAPCMWPQSTLCGACSPQHRASQVLSPDALRLLDPSLDGRGARAMYAAGVRGTDNRGRPLIDRDISVHLTFVSGSWSTQQHRGTV